MGYDQWKTASPYDDDIDPIEEAERFLKDHEQDRKQAPAIDRACMCIEALLEIVE